ncbi:MAG: rod shape-determining protein MreD [Lachnospiraceae bacterium]|nr:rod shape-determining protein MreD [Lachnospiraceae bacterium]
MKRKIVVLLLIIICFILQCTVFKQIPFTQVVPNLLIVLTSSFGFMRGKTDGLIVGLISGLLIDLFFSEFFGFNTLIYMYIGYINGFFKNMFYDDDIKLPMVLITGSDFAYGCVIYFFSFLLRGRFDTIYYFKNVIFPEVVYTVVVTLIFYRIIRRINRKLEDDEKRSAAKFV